MATKIIYEPQYQLQGWIDDGGMTVMSWFDRDVASDVIFLVRAEPMLFVNASVIFIPPPITVEVLPGFFVNDSKFFSPVSVSALDAPDQMIKNEVRRLR
jgi:hypothetical protein